MAEGHEVDSPLGEVSAEALEAMSRDELGDRLAAAAAHLDAAECRFLRMLAVFDRRGAWTGEGVRSCAHWLSWRCGIGLNAAREKVRVARALEGLPKLSQAYGAGEVSYSKVRAVTRVACPETEDYLLYLAKTGTAAHVERVVSEQRKLDRREARKQADRMRRERELTWHWDEDGALIVRASLPPEEGALFLEGLRAAVDGLRKAARTQSERAAGPGEGPGHGSAETGYGAEVGDATSDMERAEGERDEEKRAEVQQAGAQTVEVKRDGAARGDGAVEFASSMPPRGAEAETVSARHADGLVMMAERFLAAADGEPLGLDGGRRHQVVVHVQADTLAEDGPPGRCEIDGGPAIAPETARRLACDASLLGVVVDGAGQPLDIGRKTRSIPPAIARALRIRDGGCRFPGCDHRRHVDGHHLRHWADGGETSLENLVLLCRRHHALVHEGGFTVAREGVRVVFRRPDGSELPVVPARPAIVRGGRRVEAANREAGVTIDRATNLPGWRGERLDMGAALAPIRQRRARAGVAAAGRVG